MGWWEQRASLIWRLPGRVWAAMLAAGPLSLWLTAGAAMAWTVASLGLVVLFRPQLGVDQAFWVIMAALGLVMLALAALTMTELSLRFGKGGLELEVGRGGEPPQKTVVTTRTEVSSEADDEGAGDGGDGGELPEGERIG